MKVLRNEGDSSGMEFTALFRPKYLKQLTTTTKKNNIHRNLWWDGAFTESVVVLSLLPSELILANGKQNNLLVISVGPESFMSASIKHRVAFSSDNFH